jgi:hypothetical protein
MPCSEVASHAHSLPIWRMSSPVLRSQEASGTLLGVLFAGEIISKQRASSCRRGERRCVHASWTPHGLAIPSFCNIFADPTWYFFWPIESLFRYCGFFSCEHVNVVCLIVVWCALVLFRFYLFSFLVCLSRWLLWTLFRYYLIIVEPEAFELRMEKKM